MSTTPWYLNFLVDRTKVERSPEFLPGGPNKPPIPFVIEFRAREDGKRLAGMLDNAIRSLSDRDLQDGAEVYQVLCSTGVTAALETVFQEVQSFYVVLFGHRIALYISEEHAISSLMASPSEYRRGYRYASVGPALEALLTHGNLADDPLPWATHIENHASQPHVHGWVHRKTALTPRSSPSRAPHVTLKTASDSRPSTPARIPTTPHASRPAIPSSSALSKGKATLSTTTSTRTAAFPTATAPSAQSQPSTSTSTSSTSHTPQSQERRRDTAGARILGSPAQTVWQQLFYSYASIYLSRDIRQILYTATTFPSFVQRLEAVGIADNMSSEMLSLAWRFYSAAMQDDTITVLSDSDGDD